MGEGEVPADWLSEKALVGKENLLTGDVFDGKMKEYEAVLVMK